MAWQQVYVTSTNQSGATFKINYFFTKVELIVRATSVLGKPEWQRAGIMRPLFAIPGVGATKGKREYITFGTQKITWEHNELVYSLEFYLHKWVPDITLIFWENK